MVPDAVLAAFDVSHSGSARPLVGGQGSSVAVGDLVLKPHADAGEITWLAGLCARTTSDRFRLPEPVATIDGRLVVDGWSATTYASGQPVADDDRSAAAWLPVLAASHAFHRAVRGELRPLLLDTRTDNWAVADRAAWAAEPVALGSTSAAQLVAAVVELITDEELPEQLIHGDLSGNVLLDGALPPAIIDVSPYWRPAAYADAVVVVDALLWWRTSPELLELGRPTHLAPDQWHSLLARALVFRRLAFDERAIPAATAATELERYDEVVALLTRR